MMYCNKFFATRAEAQAFQAEHGGVMYSNEKGSRTKKQYMVEARAVAQLVLSELKARPYCVAWNEPDK